MTKPFPGVVRITSDGISTGTKIEVLGQDGQWHPIRCATAVEWRVPGPADLAEATVKLQYVQLDAVASKVLFEVPPEGQGLAPPEAQSAPNKQETP